MRYARLGEWMPSRRAGPVADDARIRRRGRVRTVTFDNGSTQGRAARGVAAQIVALASDEISGHVSGQVVVVAGGMEGRTVHSD